MIYEPHQCLIRFGLGAFGDRWSLLIIRDMIFRDFTRFQDCLDTGKGISTNVLSDRLRRIETERSESSADSKIRRTGTKFYTI